MRKLKPVALLSIILGAGIVGGSAKSDYAYDEVELKNIEALASNEIDPSDIEDCYNIGSIKCLDGGYAEIILYRSDKNTLQY